MIQGEYLQADYDADGHLDRRRLRHLHIPHDAGEHAPELKFRS